MRQRIILFLISWLYKLVIPTMSKTDQKGKLLELVPGLIIDGIQFYRYVNLDDMPPLRNTRFLALRQEVNMGADKPLLNEYLDKMRELNNKGDRSSLGMAILTLQDTINNCTPMETFYWCAALMYFDPKTENLLEFDHDVNSRKVEAFKKLPNPGFFLETLFQDLKTSGPESVDDLNNYFNIIQARLKGYKAVLTEL